jgi:hypothetical protein
MFGLSACLTIGCAEREDRVIDQSDNCCPNCYPCEPRLTIPEQQTEQQADQDKQADDSNDGEKSRPNITIIIDNKNSNDSDATSDIDSTNTNTNTNTQCSKQYNMRTMTEFEMTKKCEKRPPCYGKGKWKKYNGHYVLNYELNTCDDLMVEQIPCTE